MSNEQYEQFNGENEYPTSKYVGIVGQQYEDGFDMLATMYVFEDKVYLNTSINIEVFDSLNDCISFLNETFCVEE
jgi:hypothetical protein